MIRRNRTFAGVVVETTPPRALVQRAHRVRRQRAEAHRRNIEHARRIRLRRGRTDDDAEIVRIHVRGRHRMVDPFVVHAIHVLLAAERHHVHHALGALVHQRTLLTRERHFGGVALDEVLADLRADRLQSVAEVRQHRIVAAQRAAGLQQVPRPQQRQGAEDRHAQPGDRPERGQHEHRHRKQQRGGVGEVSLHRLSPVDLPRFYAMPCDRMPRARMV